VGENPTRQNAPAGSNRSNCGGNEAVEAFGDQRVTKYGDVASVQAVTRVNAEQASKRTMRGPTRSPNRGRLTCLGEQEQAMIPAAAPGYVATACTQGKRTQHGKPQSALSDEQPIAREGWVGRSGVAERPVVPGKPGNAGGGKRPQFRTNARRGKDAEIGQPIKLREVFRHCRRRCMRKRDVLSESRMREIRTSGSMSVAP
jgi:hypothetical protein